MSVDEPTRAFYDREAPVYADYATGLAGVARLDSFLARLAPGARTLDLGAGPGWAAGRMAAAGFDALAQDASAGLLEEARRRYGVPTRLALFSELEDVAAFDAIWASFSLLHAPRAAMPDLLARCLRALRPGGLFYVGLKAGAGERRDSLGRFYAYYERPELEGLLAAAGFVEIALAEQADAGRGYDGAPSRGLHALARRPA